MSYATNQVITRSDLHVSLIEFALIELQSNCNQWILCDCDREVVNGKQEQSSCSRYRLDVVRNLSAQGFIPGRDVNLTELQQEGCVDGWSYSRDIYQSTIVSQVTDFECVLAHVCVPWIDHSSMGFWELYLCALISPKCLFNVGCSSLTWSALTSGSSRSPPQFTL